VKLDWKDYVALFIAGLQTIAVPFLLVIVALLIIYGIFVLWL
jgi:hypothetical protein